MLSSFLIKYRSIILIASPTFSAVIDYKRKVLDNGLRVLINRDVDTKLASVSLTYDVGSKNEVEEKTGLAHLMEHLMFNGTEKVPDFDQYLQFAAGDSNAFTNADMTNFYELLPAENLETVLWLESDRMQHLVIDDLKFKRERNVVIEEYKETCLTAPYGLAWHHLSDLSFKQHPYKWPTIGRSENDLLNIEVKDAQRFYQRFFNPANAILSIAGNIAFERVFDLVEQYFGGIRKISESKENLITEPTQRGFRERIEEIDVPQDSFYLVFHMCARNNHEYYPADILSDILGNGKSSRLYKSLVLETSMLTEVDAYVTGNMDPGLLVIEGKANSKENIEIALDKIWEILEELKMVSISHHELEKLLNKVESNMVLSEISILNKAMSLSYYELLGNTSLINNEFQRYQEVDADKIKDISSKILTKENASLLRYHNKIN